MPVIVSGGKKKATATSLASHRGSGLSRTSAVNWRQRNSAASGEAFSASDLVHLAESQAHRDWLKATLGRDLECGEEKPQELEGQSKPPQEEPARPGSGLTRQMTQAAELFLEQQEKKNEREDRERGMRLARHDAWVESQIKKNSSGVNATRREVWRETQHAVEVQVQGTQSAHDLWLSHHYMPADEMDGGAAALQRMRKSEMSSFRVSIAAAIYCQALWRGRVARAKESAADERRATASADGASGAWSSVLESSRSAREAQGEARPPPPTTSGAQCS